MPVRENNFNYNFIYPLLRYDFGNAKYFLEDKKLEQKISDYIQQQYQLKNAESISVYFSSFLNIQWAGVNENTEYRPGSMMKVLIMMAYYRESQLNQSVLDNTFTYTSDIYKTFRASSFATPSDLAVGQSYTVRQLIEKMIADSDNGAEILLYENVNKSILYDVYKDLKITVPDTTEDYTISAKDYSAFLRILYNSTYLTDNDSEEALSVMEKSTYHEGLYAGLPSNVLVAHKYGEAVDTDPATGQVTGIELHDCGIVYDKAYPYSLCVMTRSNGIVDQKKLATIIKDISSLVHDYVDSSGAK